MSTVCGSRSFYAPEMIKCDRMQVWMYILYLKKDDNEKFTPTKHRTPPPHHNSQPPAPHIGTKTLPQ